MKVCWAGLGWAELRWDELRWAGIERVCVFVVEELEEQTWEAELYGPSTLVFVLCLQGCPAEEKNNRGLDRKLLWFPAARQGIPIIVSAHLGWSLRIEYAVVESFACESVLFGS